MHRVLLGIAAAAVAASPVSAQPLSDSNWSVIHPPGFVNPHVDRDHRRHPGGHRGYGDSQFFYGGYGYGYYYPGDYDANRSFDPDKWNDWWHERPERAFPRWVWRNQNCTEDRMWWSGAGWRCTP